VKTVKHQTARVHWRIGQALLPEHFQAQESSLREDLALRLRMLPMPFWGVGSLQWDNQQLRRGILSIQQLTLLLEDGTLVDIPGNTTPADFNLNTTSGVHASVYLHLHRQDTAQALSEDSDAPPDDRVERLVQEVTLNTQPYFKTAQSFHLGDFTKAPKDGTWAATEDFLPETLRVGDSPFFEPLLRRIRSLVTRLQQLLLNEIQVNYLANKSMLAARECLKGLYRFQALLTNLENDYHPHPFELFRALHELYIEVCMMRETPPAPKVERYDHRKLGPCFNALLDQLESQVQLARTTTPYVPFELREGMQVCELPKAARNARHVYWLLQKPGISTQLKLEGVKLACTSRLSMVHQFAMPGIPYHHIDSPPFHHSFTAEVEFFELPPGEEWDHVRSEGWLAFFHRPELEKVRAFLFWREE
jgi:type VI secretion system protein ImpJ